MDFFKLKELEPINLPNVDNHEANRFMNHLTGDETIDVDFIQKPKCWAIYDLKYKYPRHSFAQGFLFTITALEIELKNSDELQNYICGTLYAEFGGNCEKVNLSVNIHNKV